jgi:threonyl-tRNA synthetase
LLIFIFGGRNVRILAIHAENISWKANRRTKFAEPIDKKEDAMTNCVVLLSSVEKLDETGPGQVVSGAVHEVLKRLEMIKVDRVMIFPYAHLTSTLSSPAIALQILKGLEDSLRAHGVEVKRAPFGWYKEYDIKSTGHPLSELSMTICPYEGKKCDFLCPYCANPIIMKDLNEEGLAHAKTT